MISSFLNLYFFNVMFRPKVKVNFYIIHVPFFIFLRQKLFARVQSYSKKKRKHIICVSKRKKRFFIHLLFFIFHVVWGVSKKCLTIWPKRLSLTLLSTIINIHNKTIINTYHHAIVYVLQTLTFLLQIGKNSWYFHPQSPFYRWVTIWFLWKN
jgi:hypothetical protein